MNLIEWKKKNIKTNKWNNIEKKQKHLLINQLSLNDQLTDWHFWLENWLDTLSKMMQKKIEQNFECRFTHKLHLECS